VSEYSSLSKVGTFFFFATTPPLPILFLALDIFYVRLIIPRSLLFDGSYVMGISFGRALGRRLIYASFSHSLRGSSNSVPEPNPCYFAVFFCLLAMPPPPPPPPPPRASLLFPLIPLFWLHLSAFFFFRCFFFACLYSDPFFAPC